jgi:polysaccharide biosynthesis protein PelA
MGWPTWWRMMRKILKNIATALLCLGGCAPVIKPSEPMTRWAVYYDTKLSAEHFADLDLVVFDGRYHPNIKPLKGKTTVLAYVSMGEVHDDVEEKAILDDASALLYSNSEWGSHAVDLSSKKWRNIVLSHVGKAIKDGFDGVMLDTVDSPIYWASQQSSTRHKNMQQAAVSLIREIRMKHPTIKIMLNRGFDILPDASRYLNYGLAESILTQKDNSSGQFSLFPPRTYSDAVAQLHRSVARAEHLQLFTLDYWDVGDVNGLERIYAAQRASGFTPYVTSQDLRHYTPEPARNVRFASRE